MIIGIDASNIRVGGGVTHLREILGAVIPSNQGIDRIVVWAGKQTLVALPDQNWLIKVHHPWLDRGLAWRAAWQYVYSTRSCGEHRCDLLFVPGGTYVGSFRPFVTVAQNLLPFCPEERARYGLSPIRFRLHLLEYLQSFSFRRSAGILYMTAFSQRMIENHTRIFVPQTRVVHHGVNVRFRAEPRPARPLVEYTPDRPFRWLYVSMLYPYKHQTLVAEAAGMLLRRGIPLQLDFVGPGGRKDVAALDQVIRKYDPSGAHLRYRGQIGYAELDDIYRNADASIFASSCDTFGMIILEAMAAGLPVACSFMSSLPEVAGDAALYFDPLKPNEIAKAMERLMLDPALRNDLARRGYNRAQSFAWDRCANETFSFLSRINPGRENRLAGASSGNVREEMP